MADRDLPRGSTAGPGAGSGFSWRSHCSQIGALVVVDGQANLLLGVVVAGLVLVSYQRVLLAWPTLLGLILVVILFVPIRRYTVGGGLLFELEPYRIVIALVLACWFCALAADPRVRWRVLGSRFRSERSCWPCFCRWPQMSNA